VNLRQLINVAYAAVCETIGREKADEVLADMAALHDPSLKPRRRRTDGERESVALLMGGFGGSS
jgi:hypothetical protein